MSSEPVIELQGISKCFQSYPQPAYRLLQALYGQRRKLYDEFWALRDVDLEIQRGQTVGIVGKNGSGKSTLLQIIAGTLTATAGRLRANGRVSAILELGAGFNPEFTGVENARLNASIIGIPRRELDEYLPQIIEFSELGDFIDRPVKTYSSGMYVRLAFSVAINMQPDILIIDEALAVGDLKFQRKCFRKLEELRNSGVTILFVTHATDTVVNHCDYAVFIDQGRVQARGEPKTVVNEYLESLFDITAPNSPPPAATVAASDLDPVPQLNTNGAIDACPRRRTYNPAEYRWGNSQARIIDFLVIDEDGKEITYNCASGANLKMVVAVHFDAAVDEIVYGLTIKTVDGTAVYGTNTALKESGARARAAGEVAIVCFALRMDLIAAEYFLSFGVVHKPNDSDHEIVLDRRYDLCHLKMVDGHDAFGLAALDARVGEFDDLAAVIES